METENRERKIFRQSFKTLSGLAQHLESGAYKDGLTMLRVTARYVEDRLKEMGWKGSLLILKHTKAVY